MIFSSRCVSIPEKRDKCWRLKQTSKSTTQSGYEVCWSNYWPCRGLDSSVLLHLVAAIHTTHTSNKLFGVWQVATPLWITARLFQSGFWCAHLLGRMGKFRIFRYDFFKADKEWERWWCVQVSIPHFKADKCRCMKEQLGYTVGSAALL